MLGPRADIAAAAETPRFLFKFVVTGLMAASAFALLRLLARPGAPVSRAAPFLALAPLLLAVAVVVEFALVPPADYTARLVGTNIAVCLIFIPLIGMRPAGGLLVGVLRHGAPTRPGLAGAVAGLLPRAVAATFYAAPLHRRFAASSWPPGIRWRSPASPVSARSRRRSWHAGEPSPVTPGPLPDDRENSGVFVSEKQ